MISVMPGDPQMILERDEIISGSGLETVSEREEFCRQQTKIKLNRKIAGRKQAVFEFCFLG